MNKEAMYQEINTNFDYLLEDHGVDFDEGDLETNSIELFHRKADALLAAHQLDIPEADESVIALQTKLDMLIEGHGKTFDDAALDPDSWETVKQKTNVLTDAHDQ